MHAARTHIVLSLAFPIFVCTPLFFLSFTLLLLDFIGMVVFQHSQAKAQPIYAQRVSRPSCLERTHVSNGRDGCCHAVARAGESLNHAVPRGRALHPRTHTKFIL